MKIYEVFASFNNVEVVYNVCISKDSIFKSIDNFMQTIVSLKNYDGAVIKLVK